MSDQMMSYVVSFSGACCGSIVAVLGLILLCVMAYLRNKDDKE